MNNLCKLLKCAAVMMLVCGMGLCAAWAQDAGTTGTAAKPESQKVMPNPARDGKTIYDCFRALTGPPDT